jgi:hypothetical protein
MVCVLKRGAAQGGQKKEVRLLGEPRMFYFLHTQNITGSPARDKNDDDDGAC